MHWTFSHYQPPMIHFGAGKSEIIPSLINQYGKKVLLLTGSGSVRQTAVWGKIEALLSLDKFFLQTETISGEPSPELIDQLCKTHRSWMPDVVVAIGGGSVMDTGKAVSAMLKLEDSVVDYLEGVGRTKHDGRKVPFFAVPTTSGTGSEATKNAVLSRIGPAGFKKSLRHDRFVPDIAVIDPLLTLSCPPELTAASGMDALSQLLESYVSTGATPLTDALALSGLKAIARSLEPAVADGSDITARTDMAYASLLSGITLANAGLGLVHGFASAIGGFFPVPHGVICGTLMAPCMEFTLRKLLQENPHHPALNKFVDAGKSFCSVNGKHDAFYIENLIEQLYTLSEKFHLTGLGQFGITEKDLDKIIQHTDNKNNPIQLTAEEFRQILLKRL